MVNYLRQHYPGATIICAYEAGFSGFYLQEHLTENGIQCLVVHPADIPTTDKESEFKTDIRDAKKIAECLRSGQLRSIHIPTKQLQEARSLIRFRKQMRKDFVREKCRIRSFLMFYGIEVPQEIDHGGKWNGQMRNWLWNLKLKQKKEQKPYN